jgi:integrase
VYKAMIETHIANAPIATIPIQRVRTSHLEQLYATVKLAPGTITVLHAILGRALKIAVRDKLIASNPASAVEDRPRASKDHSAGARLHCWTADEARAVLVAAKKAGPQVSAFMAILLDTGCRKSEALGLTWADVDLEAGTLTIARQLEAKAVAEPVWGPTKTSAVRVVTLGPETIARLKTHRASQATLKMANRTSYQDHGLVFAKEAADLMTPSSALGHVCRALVRRQFDQVVKAADVRPIKVHGTRHTVATLLLGESVPVQVVAQRLGHADVSETLNTYAHALPSAQRDAAAKLGALLAGR